MTTLSLAAIAASLAVTARLCALLADEADPAALLAEVAA